MHYYVLTYITSQHSHCRKRCGTTKVPKSSTMCACGRPGIPWLGSPVCQLLLYAHGMAAELAIGSRQPASHWPSLTTAKSTGKCCTRSFRYVLHVTSCVALLST